MCHSKLRRIAVWITLFVMMLGALAPSAHSVFKSLSSSSITLEICLPSGETSSYTIALVDSSDFLGSTPTSRHDNAHCGFCLLPGSFDAIVDTTIHKRRHSFAQEPIVYIPVDVYVPSQQGVWQPQLPLAPPSLSSPLV